MRTRRELSTLRERLRSALVCDALDALGVRDAALSHRFEPLSLDGVMVGRAFPVTTAIVDEVPEAPYVGLLRALDALAPDDVYVISAHGRPDVSLWGELLSTMSIAAGGAGALCEGTVRDVAQVRALGFPCFAYGTAPFDINGRLEVIGHGEPVAIEGKTIRPGELLVGDVDGVVVVPEEVEHEAIERALAKDGTESELRASVAGGLKPSLAFARYGVL